MAHDTRPPPSPREVRLLLRLTLVYASALRDVIDLFSEAVHEHPEARFRFAALLDHLRALVSPGEGGLVAVEAECRALLGEGETT